MVMYGYAKDYKYTSDGGLLIQVRIPNIHGARNRSDYKGLPIRNYVDDVNLPYYPSLLLKDLPTYDQTVALIPVDSSNSSFLVLGPVSGLYMAGVTEVIE